MSRLWSVLLVFFFLSSASAINLCLPGCKSCNLLLKCSECEKGYTLYDSQCAKCGPTCDQCKVTKTDGAQYWTQCTGSCQGACVKCNSDFTCAQCSAGNGVYRGQCLSCQGDCAKCLISPYGSDQYTINCIGSCQGGCDACSGGDTCTRCRSGYVLNNGVCYACNGCDQCKFVQVTSTSYRTECVYTPTPTPDPNKDNGNTNNGNQNGTPNNNTSNMAPIYLGAVVLLGSVTFFVIKKSRENKDKIAYQQLSNTMVAGNQRQVGMPQYQAGQPYAQYQPPAINGVPPPQYMQYPPQQQYQNYPQQQYPSYPQQQYQNYPQPVGGNGQYQNYTKVPTEPQHFKPASEPVLAQNKAENQKSDNVTL